MTLPFELTGKVYFYSEALRVAKQLQETFGAMGLTFHPTPDSERVYSRIQVYHTTSGFLGYY